MIRLVDSTLRDGGYINDWNFGEEAIRSICKKIGQAGIEALEVGFVKGDNFSKDRTVFPDTECMKDLIAPKNKNLTYVGMLDMSAPVPMERLKPYDGKSFDALRVIFKKNKIDLGYEYCQKVQELGYKLFVQLVGTDNYSDEEFIAVIQKFNTIKPDAVYIVDSFGMIKRKQFLRLVYLADNNLADGIALGYHSHNNLQQAFGNAEALAELNLRRDIYIDACVFGMGRGAGNLNLELFAEYMNENFGRNYRIEPILEIADEYLADIYRQRSWGYSLPFYLSASNECHPNYAIYYGDKNALTVKAFHELLQSMPLEDRRNYSKEKAEKYYLEYQKNFIDDKDAVSRLEQEFKGREILLLAPGGSLRRLHENILAFIDEKKPLVVALNFMPEGFPVDYIFSGNMRRYCHLEKIAGCKKIITSNMKESQSYDFMLNYASYISAYPDIVDNAGLMFLRILLHIGCSHVSVAGMDGYEKKMNYYDANLNFNFDDIDNRNALIGKELTKIRKGINVDFLTPTLY